MKNETNPCIPDSSTAWQLWHNDLFDQDAPPSLEASDTNILKGLYKLWLHTLKETILDNGNASFSRFHLTWEKQGAGRVDIVVNPFNNPDLLKLRRWAGLMLQPQGREDIQRPARKPDEILWRVAQMHYELLRTSQRWQAAAVDWGAEARELLALVERLIEPQDL
jgi:hypothetical protein